MPPTSQLAAAAAVHTNGPEIAGRQADRISSNSSAHRVEFQELPHGGGAKRRHDEKSTQSRLQAGQAGAAGLKKCHGNAMPAMLSIFPESSTPTCSASRIQVRWKIEASHQRQKLRRHPPPPPPPPRSIAAPTAHFRHFKGPRSLAALPGAAAKTLREEWGCGRAQCSGEVAHAVDRKAESAVV